MQAVQAQGAELDPHSHKSRSIVVYDYNPSAGELETGALGFLISQSSLLGDFRMSETSCLTKARQMTPEETPEVDF